MLRDEGKTVLLHCVQAESRTPSIAAAYLCERFGLRASEAFEEVGRLLPNATPKPFLRHALERLWPPV
jgi:protein-tyrosine phosphatase